VSQSELPEFDTIWDYAKPAASEARFRQLLAETHARSEPADRAELLTQIARAQGLQRHFDAAHATLDAALALLRQDDRRAKARYLLERGRVFNSAGAPAIAHGLFLDAWKLARASGNDALAIDAAHMLAIVESGEAALEWNQRALELALASTDPRAQRWLGSLYNNLGWTYHEASAFERALAFFSSAIATWTDAGRDADAFTASWASARTLRSLGRVKEALTAQRALLAETERAGVTDGYILEEIGECLLALGRADEATPYFAQAFDALSTDDQLAEREPERLRRLRTLGSAS
jgi:tetratricopeptide (TPR) repeat protein